MVRILIAEDEERIVAFVAKGLRQNGYEVSTVSTGTAALAELRRGAHDLVLLDVGLPELNGFDVLGQVRREGISTPAIIVTARTGVQDTVTGLELGASDYIAKPFRFDELLARVRVRLREHHGDAAVLELGDVRLDLRARRASVAGRDVELSAREFALAEELFRHRGQALSREQLLSRVWGIDFDPGSNVVDVYVRYVRNKLGAGVIATVRGLGYRAGE
ncbi:response regulator transcription factor [Mycetocola reblochoni]|uniref:Two component system response regulator n=2 Tax=Mycetocola reblochoni TaxID=331618 RepID=A0A1R4K8V5_9MICO|nr:response regulator transcription factor [Mycetocola reblochoni]RLP68081.1 DNA-binding response regulator [Mycetocola reblochoni]SJN40624.1 two component system response regulator [Mycetocola reblochoni REB411]